MQCHHGSEFAPQDAALRFLLEKVKYSWSSRETLPNCFGKSFSVSRMPPVDDPIALLHGRDAFIRLTDDILCSRDEQGLVRSSGHWPVLGNFEIGMLSLASLEWPALYVLVLGACSNAARCFAVCDGALSRLTVFGVGCLYFL